VPTGLTNIHDLNDDLLELVLLRIPCRVTLARAAATCRPWRRLHPPLPLPPPAARAWPLLLRQKDVLHPRRALAAGTGRRYRASAFVDRVISGRDLDFLPFNYDTRSMVLTDCRGGLLAFVRYESSVVVCDPLAWQFREVLLPPTTPGSEGLWPCLGAFLLDADAADAGAGDDTVAVPRLSVSNFRVLCVPVFGEDDDDDGRLTALAIVFSARDGRWILLNSTKLQLTSWWSPTPRCS
jgi:hypothetical protein